MSDDVLDLISQLKPFSIGVALQDKEAGSNMLSVFPSEHLFSTEGVIDKQDAKVQASWLPLANFNRRTAPDVCKGQSVYLFKFADTPRYYWVSMGNEIGLQKAEHVLYSWSAVPSGDKSVANLESSYWLLMSPRDGIVRLHTSDSNSEAAKYDVTINTKEGRITVGDSKENVISLNSVMGNLVIDVQSTILLKAKDRIIFQAPDVVTKATRVTFGATEYVRHTTTMTYLTNMNVSGDMKQKGSIESSGSHKAEAHI